MMKTYLYCADESASASCPTRRLTARAWFEAESRAEAHELFARLAAVAYRGFGKAAVRQETKREHNLLTCPCTTLPSVQDYVAQVLNTHPTDERVYRALGW